MESTGPRATPVVVTATGVAAMIAWVLRDRAEFLPSGDLVKRSLSALGAAGHHAAGGGNAGPPAVAGDALASFAGLTAFALHLLMIALAAAGYGMRHWLRRSTVENRGVLVRLTFAGAAAVASALVTAVMAALLLGTAISSTATLAAAVTVLQYSFVLVLVLSAVVGVP